MMNAQELRGWLVTRVATATGTPAGELDDDQPFSAWGLESAQAAAIAGELAEVLARPVAPTALYEYPTIGSLVAAFSGPGDRPDARTEPAFAATARPSSEPLAIVGIGCRLPGADGPEAFWSLLAAGTDAIREVPPDRWDVRRYWSPDRSAPGTSVSKWAGLLEEIDGFDASFFRIPPAEAERMDPQQRLLLETSWEALEDAGLLPADLRGSQTGVFVGISVSEYALRQRADVSLIDGLMPTGGALSIAASRLSYVFDWRGPSVAVDTACSSSLVALQLATRALRDGDCDLALAAGVNLLLDPELTIGISKAGMLSPEGRCKVFDASADGYVRSEGCGVVVLKPLSSAQLDGDRVYALVRGCAVNSDGRSNGLTAPNPAAQGAVLRRAYHAAGVDPRRVCYVECHGTGTLLGDPIEVGALGPVVRPADAVDDCLVGSVKSNIGHLESAAGIAGIIKTALALHHGVIPPTVQLRQPNPRIPFSELRLRPVTDPVSLRSDAAPWFAGVSSFGFGGTNAHAVLESAPPRPGTPDGAGGGQPVLVPLSAASHRSLDALCRAWLDRLQAGVVEDLTAAARTAAVRRQHHRYRAAFVASSVTELSAQLAARGPAPRGDAPPPSSPPGVAFVFSGQGTQWAGMGTELMARDPLFASFIERCDEICRKLANWSISEVLTATAGSRLAATEYAQPVLFAVQAGLAELWRVLGITPDAVAGHSSGEIAAAYAAGFLTLDDAMRLAIERGAAMSDTAGKGRMLAVGMAEAQMSELIARHGGDVDVAAINADDQVVVSGMAEELERFLATLDQGTFTRWLPVGYPFHSAAMEAAAQALADQLTWLRPRSGDVAFYSAVTGDAVAGPLLDQEYWKRNARMPVRFRDAVEAMIRAHPVAAIVEIGPHPVLQRPLRRICTSAGRSRTAVLVSGRRHREVSALLTALAELYQLGADISWKRLYRQEAPQAPLPLYPWDHAKYWLAPQQGRPVAAADRQDHPLLGQQLPLAVPADRLVWEHQGSAWARTWLADHRVAGRPVMPAAGFIEMVLSAAHAAGLTGGLVVSDLAMRHTLPLDDDGQITQLTLTRADGGYSAELHVSSETDVQRWRRHATAHVAALPEARAESSAWVAGDCTRPADAGELYGRLARHGFDYGPAFRPLTDIRVGDGEAIGGIEIPGGPDPRFRCDPRILDGAFQLLAAVTADAGPVGGFWVPARMGQLRWHADPGPVAIAHVRVRSSDSGAPSADFRIRGPGGRLCVEVDNLAFAEIAGARPGPTITPEPQPGPELRPERSLWLYEPVWRPRELPEPTARPAGTWLVFDGAVNPSVSSIAAALRADGNKVLTARHWPGPTTAEHDEYLVDSLSPEGFPWVLAQAGLLTGVMFVCGPPETGRAPARADLLTQALAQLIRALSFSPVGIGELVVVTHGAHAVTAQAGARCPAGAAAWGLMRGLPFENPVLRHRCIDIDPDADDEAGQAALIASEIDGDDEVQVAFRDGQRFVRRLAPVADLPAGLPQLAADGWYLITGGSGGLGLGLASWLADLGARRMALLGRHAPSADAADRIAELRRSGVQVETPTADVRDSAALASALDAMRSRLGPLRGLVHAAGTLDDGPLLEMEPGSLTRVLGPKAHGVQNLHRLTAADDLDWFVMFSSAASVIGSPGQANYCAANAFLDSFAHYRHRRDLPATSINWGPWADAGMAARLAEGTSESSRDRSLRTAVSSITMADGLHMLGRIIASEAAQIVVLPYDLRDLLQFYPAGPGFAFFGELVGDEAAQLRNVGRQAQASPRPELGHEYVAARTPAEQQIVAIWQSSLGMEPIGVLDEFFELGGDSVFANQIILQVNRMLGVAIAPEDAFEDFTIAHLADIAEQQMTQTADGCDT
jgi:acyl transferase domain-containing protein/NAD(P)-dependent dehydrogenase (short-subunit alcohol dehydrogenase family)/acyl carrier protein